MYLNQNSVVRGTLTSVLLLVLVFLFVETGIAQTTSYYWVTVNPTTQSTTMYTAVGQNWTLSFEAYWTHGDRSGQAIQNATVTIQVTSTTKNQLIENLALNTTTGTFAFNYSSATADILKFSATKLVTEYGTIYDDSAVVDGGNGVFGFQSESVTVWWDTFHVSLVSSNTETSGTTTVTVNVTYLLLPEEGLTLPDYATYSHQTFLPKIVHGANVTINGVEAEESSVAGINTANVPCWFSTAYIHVGVSQEGWAATHTGFSFAHNSNAFIWTPAVILCVVCAAVLLTLYFALSRKSKSTVVFGKTIFPILGGALLAIAAFISLYWGVVGFDSALHGFDWALLGVAGLCSFGFGLAGSIMSLKKKNQALTILTVCAPLIVNEFAVKASLDIYNLATPWVIIVPSLAIAIISGILISNANDQKS